MGRLWMLPACAGPLERTHGCRALIYVTWADTPRYCADMGARVLSSWRPGRASSVPPGRAAGDSPTFCSVNAARRAITLDLRTPEGQEVARALAQRADVFVENHRPGVAERMGVGYEQLRALNPRLVYCSISGFGQDGPYRDRPGYDTIGQAMGGLLSLLTDLASRAAWASRCPTTWPASSLPTASSARWSVVPKPARASASRPRCSRPPSPSSVRTPRATSRTARCPTGPTARTPPRSTPSSPATASPSSSTSRRRRSSSRAWPIPSNDPTSYPIRASPPKTRVGHYDELETILAAVFRTQPRADWLERLRAHDVPTAPLNSLDEVFADPQVQHLGMARHPPPSRARRRASGRQRRAPHHHAPRHRLPPPVLGEHTARCYRS